MKRFLILFALALSLGGCAALDPLGKSILAGGTSLTASTANPVGPTGIYRAKIAYAATVELAVSYREYCYAKPYAALMADATGKAVCKNRRTIARALQAADDKAYAAIQTADTFVRQNPTLNATGVISAALAAVTNFQGLASGYAAQALASK